MGRITAMLLQRRGALIFSSAKEAASCASGLMPLHISNPVWRHRTRSNLEADTWRRDLCSSQTPHPLLVQQVSCLELGLTRHLLCSGLQILHSGLNLVRSSSLAGSLGRPPDSFESTRSIRLLGMRLNQGLLPESHFGRGMFSTSFAVPVPTLARMQERQSRRYVAICLFGLCSPKTL